MSRLDRNGYAPSILQEGDDQCILCGRYRSSCNKLDRHEVFGGAYRQKSKALGLWVCLCHWPCHQGPGGAHDSRGTAEALKSRAQGEAMKKYGWTTEDFIRQFGKNHL